MKFKNNVKMYRKALGFTQADMARDLDMARETFCRIERGDVLPNLVNADYMAYKLGTTVYNLWPCLRSVQGFQAAIDENRADERDRVRMSLVQASDIFLRD